MAVAHNRGVLEVRRIPADSADALRLVREMFDDVVRIYGTSLGPGPSAQPEDFSPPGGAFVALYEDEQAVAGGGLKRMYVAPHARGRGLSRVLLQGLEDAARELGYRRVRLDTGAKQHAALRLYPDAGYSEIDDYNGNPYASYWGEKQL
jgi:GNAT superfamily N-acetyltransferase